MLLKCYTQAILRDLSGAHWCALHLYRNLIFKLIKYLLNIQHITSVGDVMLYAFVFLCLQELEIA